MSGTSSAAAAFRRRFPMLERTVHLSSCSLGARSTDLDQSLGRMAADMTLGGGAWERFSRQVDRARARFARLIGADTERVAVVPNASVGAYQVASTLGRRGRHRIVSSAAEFPSISHVWLAQGRDGTEVVHAPRPGEPVDDGADSTDDPAGDYAALIDERTRLVSVPLVTYAEGRVMPVAEIAAVAHAAGAPVFVDAYQAVGVRPVRVDELGCDFLVAGTMKYLLGLPGLAFLYVRAPGSLGLDPVLTGWFGRVDPFAFDVRLLDFPAAATRFETGTPSVPAAYAANAGFDLVEPLDLAEVRDHVLALTDLAAGSLRERGEHVVLPPRRARGAHVCLFDPEPESLARFLAEHGVSVSPRGRYVRISCHFYNDAGDVAALCAAVSAYRSKHGSCGGVRVHS
ncbi:aminotransferase class V-fold PLP-dependent enzyme [Microbispora amethystogenes]|uniref:Aminotransferase YcbU n=1 Tax=Microbispora amethystogenes TaxID=1427754 RepID=A0ABQ4FPC7_9ACTN|nr:aminotransferase class V-fold PLP-dependent enzyme [Microbispora amethystogenes]GIH36603.1 putative aminotransferase YcbU [Microbispora amethystogenes]